MKIENVARPVAPAVVEQKNPLLGLALIIGAAVLAYGGAVAWWLLA